MTATKTQKKPARNKACPCGSGKKYKRCCGKDQEQPKTRLLTASELAELSKGGVIEVPKGALDPQVARQLKNDFRKQVNPYADIPGAELVRRDQMVLLAKLETTFNMGGLDKVYFEDIIANFEALKKTVQALPPCPERGPTLTDIEAQLVEFAKRAKSIGLSRTNFLTLVALRSVLGQEDAEPESPTVPEKGTDKVEDDKTIEQALGNTGQGRAGSGGAQEIKPKGDGPIEDSGSTNPSSDFQNDAPDAVEQQALGNVK